ncbi:hypothetical protein F7D91_13070, partial [Prevotella copri]|nr:hypothetical protein [Segatella copri]
LKAQKLLAQGSALGTLAISIAPCKGKSFVSYFLLLASIHKYFGISLYEFPKLTLQYYSRHSINH